MLGLPADEIFADLKPKLLSLAVGQSPVGDERQKIQTRLVGPIIHSGKDRFDYQSFVTKAVNEDPANGEVRLGRVFELALALCSEIEELGKIVEILKSMMKPNVYTSWLEDLVDATMQNCKRESGALLWQ